MGIVAEVKSKLFTKEDHFNIHKTFGIFCLCSYLYRFTQAGPRDMGFGPTPGTALSMFMHLMLSSTSLIFRIPMARIKSGYRIWPEYRIHSIVFACRSLACMLLTWVELKLQLEPNYLLNAAICLGTIAAADLGSRVVGGPSGSVGRSSTIQDLDAGPATRFFFSAMQFQATMGCMLGIRRFSTNFIYVWIIQLNAFLMTLRRKNLAGHTTLVTVYGAMLVFGFVVASYEALLEGASCFYMVNALGNFAAVLRLGLRMPKYPLWMLLAALTQISRVSIQQPEKYPVPWALIYPATVAALLSVGARKIIQGNRAAAAKAAAEDSEATLANGEEKHASGALPDPSKVKAG